MKRFLLIAVCFAVVLSVVFAGDFTYIGAKKCKMCHKGASKGEEINPGCLKCHTTGFDKGGYKIGDAWKEIPWV